MARVPAQTWATVGVCCALWLAFGSLIVGGARKHDFLNLYTGASLALDGNFAHLHDPVVQLERERRFVPERDALVPFVRPHFYAAILAPLAWIPFRPTFWVWVGAQSCLLILCWGWALLRWGPDSLIFGALFLPTALGIAHGQDCVVMLLILIGTYTLAERGKWMPSGAVLGLGVIKFHLCLLWPIALPLQKRWRMLAGFAGCIAIESAISLMLGGGPGFARYIRLLQMKNLEHLSPSPELMINVHSLVLNLIGPNDGVRAALVAIVLGLVILAVWRAPLWRWFAAASAGSLLVAPHLYGYDAGLLLLSLWLAIYCSNAAAIRIARRFWIRRFPFC